VKKVFLVLLTALCACSAPCFGGEALDRILNNMVLDLDNGGINRKVWKTVSPGNPVGQTFTTGSQTIEISRIAIADGYWNDSWTPDKSLVLTVWDSPARTTKIASAEMPYKWKAWEGSVLMYTLNAAVRPSTQYYFELTVSGGDGTISGVFAGDPYKGGSAFEGGKPADTNIWLEVHSRTALDRDAAYADRFSRWNLDYPGLEKVRAAVAAKDWDKAVEALVAYYEARTDLVSPDDKPKKNPGYALAEHELALDMKIKDDNGEIVDLGPNWNYYRTWPTRGGVGLTRSGLLRNFRGAYLNTGDEKWAKGFDAMMANMLNDMPSPIRAKAIDPNRKGINPSRAAGINGGSMWSGLSIGAQMNQMWYFYSGLASSPNFTRDTRSGMIFAMVDKAEMLSIQKGGGNWDSQMSTALYELADRHPELKQSKEWFDQGLAAMLANLWSISRSDGSVQEPTFNYTTLIINRFIRLLDTCKKLNIPVEPKYVKRVEKSIEYLMYSTEPDGDLPSRGDSFNFVNSLEQMKWAAGYFGRPDFAWLATRGAQGRAPIGTSAFFPIGGWAVMRSGWSPDALYLNLHNGEDLGHGHADELSVSIDAYGSKLIVDPGCYTYGTSENSRLYKSVSHATVTVDDADTIPEKGRSDWASMSTFDYYSGTNAGYEGIPGVKHTRRIAFVKPDYWVMSDTVDGAGERTVDSRFPFFLGAKVTLDPTTGACHTNNPGGNILVQPLPGSGLAAEQYSYGFPKNGLQPTPGVKYSTKTALPFSFTTALIPYKGNRAPARTIAALSGGGCKVSDRSGADYICFGDSNSNELAFAGESMLLRTSGKSTASLAWVNGSSAVLGGRALATSAKPIKNLEVIWRGDTVTIRSSVREPSLAVATLGARFVRIGSELVKPVTGDFVSPFGG